MRNGIEFNFASGDLTKIRDRGKPIFQADARRPRDHHPQTRIFLEEAIATPKDQGIKLALTRKNPMKSREIVNQKVERRLAGRAQ